MFDRIPIRQSDVDASEWAAVSGIVFDVQRYSLHDGPGLRTNVFIKGCPLRCQWCANPESQTLSPEPMLRAANCIDCGLFAQSCSLCWPEWQESRRSPAVATQIDERAAICPTGALNWVGERRTAGAIMAEVLRDHPFYGQGGGLTLTGGEPTMQPDFCEALLRLARSAGAERSPISTAMETCGHAPWTVFARLLPLLDTVLFDLKHIDPERHRQFTGMDNALILDNLRRIVAAGATVRVRVPLIPGFNATPDDIADIAGFVRVLPGAVQGMDLLPYHSMGRVKYTALGRDYPWRNHKRLTANEVHQLTAIAAAYDLPVTVGG